MYPAHRTDASPSFDRIVRGGRLAGPGGLFEADLAVSDGVVAALLEPGAGRATVVERADHLVVLPGLVDLCTHLREPGGPAEEDGGDESAAAAAGGFTTVVAQPAADPRLSAPEAIAAAAAQLRARAHVDVGFSARFDAVAAAGAGELRAAGAWLLDVVSPAPDVATAALRAGLPVGFRYRSEKAGALEAAATAHALGVRAVLRQVVRAATVEALPAALRRSVWVEVTPHHLVLGPEACAQVYRPLRGRAGRMGLWGRFDYIATDHTPRAAATGETGVPGLETALSVVLQAGAGWGEVVRWMSRVPAEIAGLFPRKGTLRQGADADFVLVDPGAVWSVDPARLKTRSCFSPFAGWRLPGRVVATFVRGKCVCREGVLAAAAGETETSRGRLLA